MSKSKRPPEVRQAILERLCWQVAERNDNLVAQAIYEKEEIDAIYSLEEGALLDEFFDFLKQMGIVALLEELSLENSQRLFMAVIQITLLYFLKILFGISSMNGLPDLLFSDVDAMKLLGFNGYQIKNGSTNRGDHARKHKKKQGPISSQALAENICKLSEDSVVKLFNLTIQKLVAKGFIGKGGRRYVTLTGDTTDLETTQKWEGAGRVVREKRIKRKDGKWVSVEVLVDGFKLGTMWDSQSGIPLAGKVESIEVHDHEFLQTLYDQAKENLTSISTHRRCQISKLLLDRGFLDGNFLYERDKEGVTFIIAARNNMRVYIDAHQLAKAILKDKTGGYIQERKETIFHGSGKNKTQEEVITKVVGIRNLRTYDAYTSLEEYKHKNRKDFAPHPINVVVVKEFKGKKAEATNGGNGGNGGGVVYLTNSPVSSPLKVFDDYDERSKIENQLFREGKQGWYLEKAPQKNKRAMVVHAMLTLTDRFDHSF